MDARQLETSQKFAQSWSALGKGVAVATSAQASTVSLVARQRLCHVPEMQWPFGPGQSIVWKDTSNTWDLKP